MMSTPIIIPPQSAISASMPPRTVPVENGQVVVRLMINYLAMSYDHRIIDGREAVPVCTMKGSAGRSGPPAAGRFML